MLNKVKNYNLDINLIYKAVLSEEKIPVANKENSIHEDFEECSYIINKVKETGIFLDNYGNQKEIFGFTIVYFKLFENPKSTLDYLKIRSAFEYNVKNTYKGTSSLDDFMWEFPFSEHLEESIKKSIKSHKLLKDLNLEYLPASDKLNSLAIDYYFGQDYYKTVCPKSSSFSENNLCKELQNHFDVGYVSDLDGYEEDNNIQHSDL